MPLTLNVGISKKIGLPDFGSLGANCNLEVELPHNLVFDDLEAFHRQVRQAYAACLEAVNHELAGHQAGQTCSSPPHANGNGRPGNGQPHPARSAARPATASQVRAILAIADRLHLDLAGELRTRYGVEQPVQLNIVQASQWIADIKGLSNGTGARR